MTDRTLSSAQQDQLEQLVDACGLGLVLGSFATICAGNPIRTACSPTRG
jgi:hypothetical protein